MSKERGENNGRHLAPYLGILRSRGIPGWLAAAAIAFALSAGSAAKAQSPQSPIQATQVQLDDKPMRVSIVRLAQPGCEPNCAEWIAATGRIDATTPAAFRRAFAKLGKRKLPVLIDSRGGSVDHALAIGRMIRARGLDVVVSKTVLAPCETTDAKCRKLQAGGTLMGRPEARVTICASSCAFILAGGVKRYVGPWTVVGLHEIKSTATMRHFQRLYRVEHRYSWGVPVEVRRTLVRERTLATEVVELATSEQTYEKIRKYFAEMGVSGDIMPILRSAPNSSIRWLRPAELRTTALATDLVNGEQLLTAAAAIVQPAAAPSPTAIATAPAPTVTVVEPAAAPQSTAATAALTSQPQATAQPPQKDAIAAAATAISAVPAAKAAAAQLPATRGAPAAKAAVAKPKPRPARTASPAGPQEERRLPLGFQ